jgi:hypothetical protein
MFQLKEKVCESERDVMFKVSAAVTMVIPILWNKEQCRHVERRVHFKGTKVKDLNLVPQSYTVVPTPTTWKVAGSIPDGVTGIFH